MKKIWRLSFVFLFLLILCSCDQNIQYQVVYNLDGGTFQSSDYPESFIKSDGLSKLPTPLKEGYTFKGWKLDQEIITNFPKKYKGDKTLELTAIWEKLPTLELLLSPEVINLGSSAFLTIEGYTDASLFDITLSNDHVFLEDWLCFTSQSIGITEITITLKSNPQITNTITVEVIDTLPIIYTISSKLALNTKSYFNIRNLDETLSESLEDYSWSVDDETIAVLNDDFSITGLTEGTVYLTATSKLDPRVQKSLKLSVVDENTSVVLNTLDSQYQFLEGDIFDVKILGSTFSPDDFNWSTNNSEVLRILESGEIIAVEAGVSAINVYQKSKPSNRATYTIFVEECDDIDYIGNLINKALSQVGYEEGPNNDSKYGDWYKMPNQPWCAMFVSWCWYEVGLSHNILLKYCGCSTGQEWCIEQGIFQYKESYHPKTGDIVFFTSSGMSHTGICAYADDTYLYTIEGNSSNKVGIWRWSLKDARITGYATPIYPTYTGESKDFSYLTGLDTNNNYYWTNVTEKQPVT